MVMVPTATKPPRPDRDVVVALLFLTFVTGMVDAASVLGLGHVFTANMTGNVVFLGFALAGMGTVSIVSGLNALGCFLVGAAVGGRIGKKVVGAAAGVEAVAAAMLIRISEAARRER